MVLHKRYYFTAKGAILFPALKIFIQLSNGEKPQAGEAHFKKQVFAKPDSVLGYFSYLLKFRKNGTRIYGIYADFL
ncbi:MAG TPA: hypothetical protein DEH25_09660 [Chloroflexi bacterium]|nr:hypothetical protein [Chloroflexota bacterium]HBY06406.1 hypothetical protein [Chloroflexota bacterium]